QDVVPADLAALQLDDVPNVEHADRPHIDTGLFQGLPRRGGLDRLADLQGPARETPQAPVRIGSPLDQEDGPVSEHDRADGGRRSGSRTCSRTFQTPTGMRYPGWVSRRMTVAACRRSRANASATARRAA